MELQGTRNVLYLNLNCGYTVDAWVEIELDT